MHLMQVKSQIEKANLRGLIRVNTSPAPMLQSKFDCERIGDS